MVRFFIEEVEVFFPYDYVYPEQLEYMKYLKQILDAHSHGVLEMPTGTGKTVTLFSFITSYQLAHPNLGRLIYCTRTVAEMEKALLELKTVINYRIKELQKDKLALQETNISTSENEILNGSILAIGMSARRNLCINPSVISNSDRDKIDAMCRSMTAPWVRAKKSSTRLDNDKSRTQVIDRSSLQDIEDIIQGNWTDLCPYYEIFDKIWSSDTVPIGVYTIDELRRFGKEWEHPTLKKNTPFCPYYSTKRLI